MASKRRIRRKACGNKVKFDSIDDANKVLFPLLRKNGYTETLHAYRCKFCRKYHFGHVRSSGYRNLASIERIIPTRPNK